MEARVQADRGPWALWHGHSPILLCASQNVTSGMSEELEQWAGDVGNRKEKVGGDYHGGAGVMECQGWSGEEEVVDGKLGEQWGMGRALRQRWRSGQRGAARWQRWKGRQGVKTEA